MKECESIRGEWGEICPDCKQRLPAKPEPMTSWKARKEIDAVQSEYSRLRDASRLFMPRWLKAPLRKSA